MADKEIQHGRSGRGADRALRRFNPPGARADQKESAFAQGTRSGYKKAFPSYGIRRGTHSRKQEAACYVKTFFIQNGTGDANDVWRINVIGAKDGTEILTVSSKLRFVHYLQSCVLTTSGKQLPKWAYEQQEVSCNPNLRDPNAYWNVEENIFEKRRCASSLLPRDSNPFFL